MNESKELVPYKAYDPETLDRQKSLGVIKQVLGNHLYSELKDIPEAQKSAVLQKSLPIYVDAINRGSNLLLSDLKSTEGVKIELSTIPGVKEYRLVEGILQISLRPESKDPFKRAEFFRTATQMGFRRETISGLYHDSHLVDLMLKRGLMEQEKLYWEFLKTVRLSQEVNKLRPEFLRTVNWPDIRLNNLQRVSNLLSYVKDDDLDDEFITKVLMKNDPIMAELSEFSQYLQMILRLNSLFINQNGTDIREDQKENFIGSLAVEMLMFPTPLNEVRSLRSPETSTLIVEKAVQFLREANNILDADQFKIFLALVINNRISELEDKLSELFIKLNITPSLGINYLKRILPAALINLADDSLQKSINRLRIAGKPNLTQRPKHKIEPTLWDVKTILDRNVAELIVKAKTQPTTVRAILRKYTPEARVELIKKAFNSEKFNTQAMGGFLQTLAISYQDNKFVVYIPSSKQDEQLKLQCFRAILENSLVKLEGKDGESWAVRMAEVSFKQILKDHIKETFRQANHVLIERENHAIFSQFVNGEIRKDVYIEEIINNTLNRAIFHLLEGNLDDYNFDRTIKSLLPTRGPVISPQVVKRRAINLMGELRDKHFGEDYKQDRVGFFKEVISRSLQSLDN